MNDSVINQLKQLLKEFKNISSPTDSQIDTYMKKANKLYFSHYNNMFNMPVPNVSVDTGSALRDCIKVNKKRARMLTKDVDKVEAIADKELKIVKPDRTYRYNYENLMFDTSAIQPATAKDIIHYIGRLIDSPEYLE